MSSDRMYQATRQQQALLEDGRLEDKGGDYDTEDAPSQSEIDEEIDTVRSGRPQRPGQPTCARDHSPVTVRHGSLPVLAIGGVERSNQQVLCLKQGCPYPARLSENFRFCSRTCGRLV
jgi:hypothetical protein